MANSQIYHAHDDEWATYTEIVENEPVKGDFQYVPVEALGDRDVQWILGVVSTPNGSAPNYLDSDIEILDKNGNPLDKYAYSAADSYIASPPRIIVLDKPQDRNWSIKINSGDIPFAVSILAFHPSSSLSTFSPGQFRPPTFKCKICKTCSKALAISIITAMALPAIPPAVISAVSSYLGMAAIFAAAFINSVLGDTADEIAEKLCKQANLCP